MISTGSAHRQSAVSSGSNGNASKGASKLRRVVSADDNSLGGGGDGYDDDNVGLTEALARMIKDQTDDAPPLERVNGTVDLATEVDHPSVSIGIKKPKKPTSMAHTNKITTTHGASQMRHTAALQAAAKIAAEQERYEETQLQRARTDKEIRLKFLKTARLGDSMCKQLIECYYNLNGPAARQQTSYDDFVRIGVRQAIQSYGRCEISTDEITCTIELLPDTLRIALPRLNEAGRPCGYSLNSGSAVSGSLTHTKGKGKKGAAEAIDDESTVIQLNSLSAIANQDMTTGTSAAARVRMSSVPTLYYPSEARARDFTYMAQMFCDVRVTTTRNSNGAIINPQEPHRRLPIGAIPVMLRSVLCNTTREIPRDWSSVDIAQLDTGVPDEPTPQDLPGYAKAWLAFCQRHESECLKECDYDYGGTFIIRGSEKVVITQERVAGNKLLAFDPLKGANPKVMVNSRVDPFLVYGGSGSGSGSGSGGGGGKKAAQEVRDFGTRKFTIELVPSATIRKREKLDSYMRYSQAREQQEYQQKQLQARREVILARQLKQEKEAATAASIVAAAVAKHADGASILDALEVSETMASAAAAAAVPQSMEAAMAAVKNRAQQQKQKRVRDENAVPAQSAPHPSPSPTATGEPVYRRFWNLDNHHIPLELHGEGVLMCEITTMFNNPVPFMTLIKALGMTDNVEIVSHITRDYSLHDRTRRSENERLRTIGEEMRSQRSDIQRLMDMLSDSDDSSETSASSSASSNHYAQRARNGLSRRTCSMIKVLRDSIAVCEYKGISTQEQALHILSRDLKRSNSITTPAERAAMITDDLETRLLPHIGTNCPLRKAMYMCRAVNHLLLRTLNYEPWDNRDSYEHKRTTGTGELMQVLLQRALQSMMQGALKKQLKNHFERRTSRSNFSVPNFFNTSTHVTNAMVYAMSTGNWVTSQDRSYTTNQKGVTQTFSPNNYAARLALVNQVRMPLDDKSKATKPRQLQNTQWGIRCPAETPEGGPVGLSKSMALLVHVSVAHDQRMIIDFLRLLNVIFNTTPERTQVMLYANNEYHSGVSGLSSGYTNNIFPSKKIIEAAAAATAAAGNPTAATAAPTAESLVGTMQNVKLRTQRRHLRRLKRGDSLRFDTDGYASDESCGDICEDAAEPDGSQARESINSSIKNAWGEYEEVKINELYRSNRVEFGRRTPIILNGREIGCTGNPGLVVLYMRFARRHGCGPLVADTMRRYRHLGAEGRLIARDVSIVYQPSHSDTLEIRCDAGRDCRPLLVVHSHGVPTKEKSAGLFSLAANSGVLCRLAGMVSTPEEMDAVVDEETGERRVPIPCIPDTEAAKTFVRYADEKRLLLELAVAENRKIASKPEEEGDITWDELYDHGIIELVDTTESQTAMIAMSHEDLMRNDSNYPASYTHCEIHPSTILGVSASQIPFPDHNQSPRNTYQSAMGKQAQGYGSTKPQFRVDTISYEMWYPQKPMVTTWASNFMHNDVLPAGQNAIVAIYCYTGYNQEDAVILSQSSIDRGLFRSYTRRTCTVSCKAPPPGVSSADSASGIPSAGLTYEIFEVPSFNEVIGCRANTYSKLDPDGTPQVGVRYEKGDAYVGKVLVHEEKMHTTKGGSSYRKCKTDKSPTWPHDTPGVCEQVVATTNGKGERMYKIKFRVHCVPQIGDKFSSRHGQKGTCGMTYRQEDMPYTKGGMSPDIIMNPHAIPSRMTIGHIVETLGGKVGLMTGNIVDSTPFTDLTVKQVCDVLRAIGFHPMGNERLYNGHTGQMLPALCFFGPTYYQRLKHMVDDKIQARSRGPVDQLTKQPTQGKARGGGIRFGEMERDCIISHGGAAVMQDRMMTCSDGTKVPVCGRCGIMGQYANASTDSSLKHYGCKMCNSTEHMRIVNVPASARLLTQELMAMGIRMRYHLDGMEEFHGNSVDARMKT